MTTSGTSRILAIGHDATRTGAPILLQTYLGWLASQQDVQLRCVLGRGGPLVADMEAICDTHVEALKAQRNYAQRILRKLRRHVGRPQDKLQRWCQNSTKPDLIYANTVASAPTLQRIRSVFPDIPYVLHVHELTDTLKQWAKTCDLQCILASASTIIAASRSVKQALRSELGVKEGKIAVIHEYLCREIPDAQEQAILRKEMRNQLGLSSNTKVVLGLGTVDLRKGTDLFVRLPAICKTLDAHFVWVGKNTTRFGETMASDVDKLGVGERMHFAGEVSDPSAYLAAADVLALTSREDPYPLAMLEAAAFGLAVVGFEKSGGFAELASQTGAPTIPYLEVGTMGAKIDELLQSDAHLRQLGEAAHQHVTTAHSLEETAPQIWQVMLRAMQRA